MKKIISLALTLSILLSLFSGLEMSVFASSSTTSITILEDIEEHMIGSSFAVSASYYSDTYSHNAETITYEIVGDTSGLIVNGGLSYLGSKEKDGIISLPLKAIKIGEYTVVLNGPDGAVDSIKIIVSDKPYDVYLAENIFEREKFLSSTDTIIQLSDYGWMQSNEVMLYFNDMSVQQYVETMLVRILIGKIIDEENIYESYAEAASLVTKCMSGIQSIDSSVTEETTFNAITDLEIKNQIKTYINDMYEFDVFDTLSTTVDGAISIVAAIKQASYYRVISDVLSVEEISDMLSATVATIDSSEYENTLLLAFNHVIEIIENTDLEISEYFANSAINYGIDSLTSLTLDIAKALAFNALNAVAPGLGTAISVGMTVYEICKVIDDLCQSKLEAVQINLSVLSMFCDVFKYSIESSENNAKENAKIIVENYKCLLSANKIAIEVQQENIDILSKNLLESVSIQPAFSLQQLLKNIDILGGKTDSLYSTYLVTERYPVVLNTLKGIVDNEYSYIKTVTEDYLYYSYGMDLFKYTSDLWEIETKFVVTLDANFDDNSFLTKQYYYFSKGETLDERTRPYLRSGYDFIGWYTDRECTTEYNFDNAIESNFTLYAKWAKKINYVENEDGTATVTSINSRQSRNSTMQLFSLTRTVENPAQTALEQIQTADSIVPLFVDGKSIVSIASNAVSPDCSSIYIPEIVENIENGAISKPTCIVCWPNSYAHRYAESNGYDYVLLSFEGTDENASEIFTYAVNDDGYSVTITGLVDNCSPSNLYIPSRINGYTVTAIGHSALGYPAFDNLDFLKQVSIPFSVSYIGANAFYNCVNLSTVTLNNGLKSIGDDAFGNCKSLDSIVIPETVTSLGDCFNECTGLRELTMPVSAKIYYYEFGYIDTTFENCTNIEKVTLTKGSGNMQSFGNYTCTPWYISGCKEVVISEGVSNISYKAFYNCSSLEKIMLPNSVTQIDEYAFYNCTNLQNITFPSKLSSIGRNAFYNCMSIDTIVLPNSLLSISTGAFYGCISLDKVIIGDNVSQIGDEAFYKCSAITELSLPASAKYGLYTFSECSNIKQVTITSGNGQMYTYSDTRNHGNTIFYQYSPWFISGCKKIIINNGVTNISDFAFYNCTSVECFELSNSLTTIGKESFRGCTNLKSIEIPKSVTNIKDCAFFHCDSLTDVYYNGTQEQWSNILIGGQNYNLTNSTIHYNGVENKEPDEGDYIVDDDTKVSIAGVTGVDLVVSEITSDTVTSDINIILVGEKARKVFNVTLQTNGVEVQPDGIVWVKIPADNSESKVYRMEKYGTLTDMNAVYKGGYLIFATEHFSVYVVAEPEKTDPIVAYMLGDANEDGKVNIKDATEIQKHIANLITLSDEGYDVADVDGSGSVNIKDATAIQKHIAGIEIDFPVGKPIV